MPEIITKHFDPQFAESIAKCGKFQLGTLKGYRESESSDEDKQTSFLLSDKEEGISSQDVLGNHFVREMRLPNGIFIKDSFFGYAGKATIRYSNVSDGYVFCASKGRYSKSRHEKILDGDSNYTAYVELNLELLLKALHDAFCSKLKLHSGVIVIGDDVVYEDRGITVSLLELSSGCQTDAAGHRSLFYKPPRFSHEEEVRLAFLDNQRKLIEPNSNHLLLESQALAKSIITPPTDINGRRLIY